MRASSEGNARRLAAAVSGAIEGFLEGLEAHDLGNTAGEALSTAGEVARAAGEETANQAATPEMQQIGRGVKRVGEKIGDTAASATDSVRSTVHDAKMNVQTRVDDVRAKVNDVKEDVKFKASATAETGRRARRAPPRIAKEWRAAFNAWWTGLKTSVGLMSLVGVIAITAWILLTIALVVAFNRLLGDPIGTFLVFGIYVLAALGAYAGAKTARKAANERRARHMQNAGDEVRHVTRPVREAFAKGSAANRRRSGI